MHEAFYFGPDDCQAFGIYHPSADFRNQVLTVICPPLFAEFNRSYAALRRLAVSLADHGQHVLRFDYRATGDSFGELGDASLGDWMQDIENAIEEGLELSGCTEVHVLGCRASSLLACKSVGNHERVRRLVLWDPVSDGRRYLDELLFGQRAVLEQHPHLEKSERNRLTKQLGMYDLSPTMINEFENLDSDVYAGLSAEKVRLVTTQPENDFEFPGITNEKMNIDCDWETNTAGVILSQQILECLLSKLTKS